MAALAGRQRLALERLVHRLQRKVVDQNTLGHGQVHGSDLDDEPGARLVGGVDDLERLPSVVVQPGGCAVSA
jgi:hypothetical protein